MSAGSVQAQGPACHPGTRAADATDPGFTSSTFGVPLMAAPTSHTRDSEKRRIKPGTPLHRGSIIKGKTPHA